MKKCALLIVSILLVSACAGKPNKDIHAKDLGFISDIQRGGYVIFFRHAATDQSQKDTDMQNLADCDKQRRLNGLGRSQSKVIGKSFQKLKIPVGDIITSPYCRCINTAKLAFGRAEPTMAIASYIGVTKMEARRRVKALKDMLAVVPRKGTNTVIVGHKLMFKDASGILIEEGEAAIFEPSVLKVKGEGSTKLVATVKPNEWQKVGQAYSNR